MDLDDESNKEARVAFENEKSWYFASSSSDPDHPDAELKDEGYKKMRNMINKKPGEMGERLGRGPGLRWVSQIINYGKPVPRAEPTPKLDPDGIITPKRPSAVAMMCHMTNLWRESARGNAGPKAVLQQHDEKEWSQLLDFHQAVRAYIETTAEVIRLEREGFNEAEATEKDISKKPTEKEKGAAIGLAAAIVRLEDIQGLSDGYTNDIRKWSRGKKYLDEIKTVVAALNSKETKLTKDNVLNQWAEELKVRAKGLGPEAIGEGWFTYPEDRSAWLQQARLNHYL